MASIVLQSDWLSLVIRPELGAGISDFSVKGPAKYFHPVMRRASDAETNPSNLACFVMAPWANRIGDGRLTFGGQVYPLKVNASDGSAIHGDVRHRAFAILDRSPVSARLGFDSRTVPDANYPFPFEVIVRYELAGLNTKIAVSVANLGDKPMPAGCGIHPYFMRRLWSENDAVTVSAPVTGQYQLSNRLATGPCQPDALSQALADGCKLPDMNVDTVFGGCHGPMRINYPASGVHLNMDPGANQPHIVLFVPHEPVRTGGPPPDGVSTGQRAAIGGGLPYFAFEPQTNVNDGFNLVAKGALSAQQAGTVVLAPGERLETQTEIFVTIE